LSNGIYPLFHIVYTYAYPCCFPESIMAEAVLDIKQWGYNLGVRLPAAVAREAHLHVDQRVRISVEGAQVVITPVSDVHLTLEQRLAYFDPGRHGGEVMVASRHADSGNLRASIKRQSGQPIDITERKTP
jgi:antitoxin MazE